MRILLANNRYFPSGGPERYLFAAEQALRERGHEVTPFALAYRRNEPTDVSPLFPAPPLDDEFVLYGDRALSWGEKLRLARKVVRNPEVYEAAVRVLRERRIEVVYALQIAHYLYPELLRAAADVGVPVVMRLSDYQLVCPAYNCLRAGRPCFECRHGYLPALVHRCLKQSLPITAVRVAAMQLVRLRRIHRAVRFFVAPSKHLLSSLSEAGFDPFRLIHLPTPMALPPDPGPPPESGPLLFVGGLYEAKGAQVAIEAARGTGRTLVIAGDTDTPEGRRLCEYVAREQITEVRFAGFQTGEALSRLYAECAAVIVPSLWWENVPHVALEAMAQGRPVLASNHGSLPEVVTHGRTGLLFTPGDALALRRAIEELARSGMAATYGREARRWIAAVADPASHFARLEDILTRACR